MPVMVLLKHLNRICAARPASRTFPAQVACRLTGNTEKPCVLDPVCKPCETHGLWVMYASLGATAAAGFCFLYWVLRLTRASRLLWLVAGLLLPPLQWVVRSVIAVRRWWDSLFF